MLIKITSLYAMNAGEEMGITFEVTSDDGLHTEKQTFVISSKQYLLFDISKGECGTELYDTVARAARVWQAVRRGVSLLGYGACSEKALRSKLVMKGFDRDIAADAVEELVSMGLIRPNDDAFREAQRLAAKLLGKRRIVAGLYEKGYSAEAVAAAMNLLEDEGIDYVRNCRELIRKRYGGIPDSIAEKRKLYSALQRYGYSLSEIKDASYFSFSKEK